MRSLCIVPVYNQANELPRFIAKCQEGLVCDDILFVDDGSTDGSSQIIRDSGFKYFRVKDRKGIGHALILGTKYAIQEGFQIVVHMAGNGKMLPREMPRVLSPLLERKADYVWGSRFLPGGNFANAPGFRKYGIPVVFNKIPLLFTGKTVTDATCGYRAYRISLLDEVAAGWDQPWLFGYEFEYFVLSKVLTSRLRYREVPISMIYPPTKKNYSKIIPVISWWAMFKPWLFVALKLDRRMQRVDYPFDIPKTVTAANF